MLDFMFYLKELLCEIGCCLCVLVCWMVEVFDCVFVDFLQVKGVIFCFGEFDGCDVGGDFCLEFVVCMLKYFYEMVVMLFFVFECYWWFFVVCIWLVGVYGVGDLMWNWNIFDCVFGGFDSDFFVVLMKFGEFDFFCFLLFNLFFFCSDYQKIVELQVCCEYEGFGEFFLFVGWLYVCYCEVFEEVLWFIGMSLWCQIGGWMCFCCCIYLGCSLMWNEFNVEVMFFVFKNWNVEMVVEEFFECCDLGVLMQCMMSFLCFVELVIEDFWYVDDVVCQEFYFCCFCLLLIFIVFWDNILINYGVCKLLCNFVYQLQVKIE